MLDLGRRDDTAKREDHKCEQSEPGAVAMGSTLKLRVDRVATARRSDTRVAPTVKDWCGLQYCDS